MTKDKIFVIDGGFSTQLASNVTAKVDGDPLWSARFNFTEPKAVIKSHLDFLKGKFLIKIQSLNFINFFFFLNSIAGADVILTNTYQASVEGYTEYLKLTPKESVTLIKDTVKLAHEARDLYVKENPDKNPLIAASIGPYGAHLHDGSEYTGSYAKVVAPETIKEWHRRRIEACLDAGVDLLAIETIPCQIEAEVLVDMISHEYKNVKFWISLQCKDESHLANGEDFSEVVSSIWNRSKDNGANIIAIGVNCLAPTNVTPLFKSVNDGVAKEDQIPLIVYPNSGESYDVKTG